MKFIRLSQLLVFCSLLASQFAQAEQGYEQQDYWVFADAYKVFPEFSSLNDNLTNTFNADMRFEKQRMGGIQRLKLPGNVRMRGWQLSQKMYFGQAKVADHWGLGIVYQHKNNIYGFNNKGFQFTKQF